MTASFEQRRDEIHEAILRGDIGCPFASGAARRGEIDYVASPRRIDPLRPPASYIEGIAAFARRAAATTLVVLPDEDSPESEEACAAYSALLYPETVSSMQFATHRVLDHLFSSELQEFDDVLYEYLEMDPHANRHDIFRVWRQQSWNLAEAPGGTASANLLRAKTQEIEPVFAFTMDPTYMPVKRLPHPRWSPHYMAVMNYRNDLQHLHRTHPALFEATQQWLGAAVGYKYVQGVRIPQQPAVQDADRASWKLQD